MTDDETMGGVFREMRQAQRWRRVQRLPAYTKQIGCLSPEFKVKRLTMYQFRVNDRVDLYPIHRRFHDTKTGERGDYKNALELCRRLIA